MLKIKSLLLVLFLMFSVVIFGQTPEDVYEKYKDNNDVTCVVINKELMDNIGSFEGSEVEGLDSMILLSTDKFDIKSGINLNKYDELMRVSEGGDNILVYGKIKKGIIKKLLILIKEEDLGTSTLIYIEGDLDLNDIEKISKSSM